MIQKKIIALLFIFSFSSCASMINLNSYSEKEPNAAQLQIDPNKTMNSDLTTLELTEAEYYKEMAIGTAQNNNCSKAQELAQISLSYLKTETEKKIDLDELNYSLAVCFYNNKFYGSSLEYVQKITIDNKYDYAKLNLVADIYEKAQSYYQAAVIYDKLFSLTKDLKYKWKVFDMNYQSEQFDFCFQILDELLLKHEDEYKINYSRYMVNSKIGKDNEALNSLLMAEKYHQYDYELLLLIAQLQKKLHKWEDLSHTVNLFNNRYSFNYEMTGYNLLSLVQLKKYDEASLLYNKITLDRPYLSFAEADFYPDLQMYLAKLDWNSKKQIQAIEILKNTYEYRPDSLYLVQLYAKYLIWSGQVSEALTIIEASQFRHPDNEESKILKADAFVKKNDLDGFYKTFDEVKDYNSDQSEIYSVMAEVWFHNNKPVDETEKLIEKSLALNSENPNLKPILGQLKLKQKDLNMAMSIFENLYNENPTDDKYGAVLSDIYSQLELPQKKFELENKATRKPASQ